MSNANRGYTFPWEQAAIQGRALPDGLPLHDQMAFLAVRTIYRSFFSVRMGREEVAVERGKVFAAWDKARRTVEFDHKLAFYQARLHKDTERAATAVRKNPTPENAILLCDVLDGLREYRPEADGDGTACT